MLENARVLPFRAPAAPSLTPEESRDLAHSYLATPSLERGEALKARILSNPDALISICLALRDLRDSSPQLVRDEASSAYNWIKSSANALCLFDERDYFLGEFALLAGMASRVLGRREEAIRWLDRAEAGFRHTVNPGPGLSSVSYVRLSLKFETGNHDEVLELLPSLRSSFERMGMLPEDAKCGLLEAMILKGRNCLNEALEILEPVRLKIRGKVDPHLEARLISEVADLHQTADRFDLAVPLYQEALALLQGLGTSMALADLKMFVGSAHRDRGHCQIALEAFRSAVSDYHELGMSTRVAYMRIVSAEMLLKLGRNREAEWEILAAIPTIEQQDMAPEAIAAVALLRESIRRKRTDPTALQDLRDHLQKRP